MKIVKFDEVMEGDVINILSGTETLSFELYFKNETIVKLRCEDLKNGDVSRVTMTKKEFDEGGFTRQRRHR